MPPTEGELLSSFLLAPAPLPSIISLQKFTDLFPRPQQSSPQIKHLYHNLQGRRALDIEHIKRNVTREVKQGEKQRRHIVKARLRGAYGESEPIQGPPKSAQTEVSASKIGSSNGDIDKSSSLKSCCSPPLVSANIPSQASYQRWSKRV